VRPAGGCARGEVRAAFAVRMSMRTVIGSEAKIAPAVGRIGRDMGVKPGRQFTGTEF